jgi:hypothetical protein
MAVRAASLPDFPLSRLNLSRLFESGNQEIMKNGAVRAASFPAFPFSRLDFSL